MKLKCSFLHTPQNTLIQPDTVETIENGCLEFSESGQIESLIHDPTQLGSNDFDYSGCLAVPGFIDLHTHYPQTLAIAAPETELLSWLNRRIFPEEERLNNPATADSIARLFVSKLLENGTTTACVYGSQFYAANKALFDEVSRSGLEIYSGLTLMDRHSPDALSFPFKKWIEENQTLYELSLKHERVHYTVTPRFAISCSAELLEYAGDFSMRHQTWIQTHINETKSEIEWASSLFPEAGSYLQIYDSFNLIHSKSILGHSIHTTDQELELMHERKAKIAHCASSNFFLGSGCFPMQRHQMKGVAFGIGTDVGAGTQFSMLRELGDVYKAQQLLGNRLRPRDLLYLATRAGADILNRADLGCFGVGCRADFVVFDWANDPYLTERVKRCESVEDIFFTLIFLAEQRHVRAVFKDGRRVVSNPVQEVA